MSNSVWTEANVTWDELYKNGGVIVGTLMEMKDGQILLVGDVNEKGGLCECCSLRSDIVLRYKSPVDETMVKQ